VTSKYESRLNKGETGILKSQIVISSWGGSAGPFLMPSRSKAWPCSPASSTPPGRPGEHRIMRAFIRLRRMLASMRTGPQAGESEKKYDVHFKMVFDAIRKLMVRRRPSGVGLGLRWMKNKLMVWKKLGYGG